MERGSEMDDDLVFYHHDGLSGVGRAYVMPTQDNHIDAHLTPGA